MTSTLLRRLTGMAALILLVVATLVPAGSAGAQPPDDPADAGVSIVVDSVSPWVDAEGTWSAALQVIGAPADAKITYSVRQPPVGTEADVRDALARSRDGEDEPKVMRATVRENLADLTDVAGTTTLQIAIRSGSGDSDRVKIPNSGVYPVVITVASADGTALERTTLFLNRLPAAEENDAGRYRLGIVLQQPRFGGFDDDGQVEISAALRSSVAAITDTLAAADGLPVRVDLSPESLVALTQSETTGDLQLAERLRDELGDAAVMRVPWADLHLEGWATSGTLPEVQTSLIDGQQALFARLQRPVEVRVWPPDPTVGPSSVELFSKLGVTTLLVEPGQLTESKAPTGESGVSRPFRVLGTGGSTITGVSLDPELQQLLGTTSDSPALLAHQMITQMVGTWLADDQARGSILRIDESSDPDVVAALLDILGNAGDDAPLEVVDPADVAALPPITVRQGGRDVAWDRELEAPAETPRVTGVAQRLRTARPLVDDYAAIVPRGDAMAAREAIVIQRSLDRRVTPGVQETLLDTAITAMESDLAKISASKPRSLTLTSRSTSVPLRFTNDLGRPIRVKLRLQSPRLVFTDGAEQVLTLNPGLNRFDVKVDVRTSGQFVMQADLLAPDSDRVLASTRQRIRSRTFSGVGLMLSGGALLFLVIWWSRTLRRTHRTPDDPNQPDEADPNGAADTPDGDVPRALVPDDDHTRAAPSPR